MTPETSAVVSEIVQAPQPSQLLETLYPVLDQARALTGSLAAELDQKTADLRGQYAGLIADAESKVFRYESAKNELQALANPVQAEENQG